MLQIIEIIVDNKKYQIEWNLSEYFDELKGMKFMLNKMAANQIVMINNLSETAKIYVKSDAAYTNFSSVFGTDRVEKK